MFINQIQKIPLDLRRLIWDYLSIDDFAAMKKVSKSWRHHVEHEETSYYIIGTRLTKLIDSITTKISKQNCVNVFFKALGLLPMSIRCSSHSSKQQDLLKAKIDDLSVVCNLERSRYDDLTDKIEAIYPKLQMSELNRPFLKMIPTIHLPSPVLTGKKDNQLNVWAWTELHDRLKAGE